MRWWSALCLLFMLPTGILAQEFDTHWIASPSPDSTSHVWFRQTYLAQGRARDARVEVKTRGCFQLYVNEHHVGTAASWPDRSPGDSSVVTVSFDVAAYLRPDTNVVALAYSPAWPHVEHRQISVSFYGHQADGQAFCHVSDSNWLCKPANSRLKADGGERIDGRRHDTTWKSAWFDPALWRGVQATANVGSAIPCQPTASHPASFWQVAWRRGADYAERSDDGIDYHFSPAFYGKVRITLRNAKRGQHIRCGNIDYICSGEMDEQLSAVFSLASCHVVRVGGERFSPDLVTEVEAVAMTAGTQHHWDE